jgi:hypothetical protein
MDDQPDIPINLRGVYFQGQPCLENIPSFPDWKPGDGPSMNDQSWKRPPTHLFEQPMDFHALSGTELPRKTATSTFSKSVSVSVELPSPINEKVRYKQVNQLQPGLCHQFCKNILTHCSDEPRTAPHRKPFGNARRSTLIL